MWFVARHRAAPLMYENVPHHIHKFTQTSQSQQYTYIYACAHKTLKVYKQNNYILLQ